MSTGAVRRLLFTIEQDGESDPVAEVLYNSYDVDFTFSRVGVGHYRIWAGLGEPFQGVTPPIMGFINLLVDDSVFIIYKDSGTELILKTYDGPGGMLADTLLTGSLETFAIEVQTIDAP